jgi:hypothetical protein
MEKGKGFLRTGLAIIVLLLTGSFIFITWLKTEHTVKQPVRKTKTFHHRGGAFAATITDTVSYREPNYTTLLKKYIPEFVSRSTNGLYRISFRDIRVDVLAGKIDIKDIRFQSDAGAVKRWTAKGQPPQYIADITIPSVQMTGVSFVTMLKDKSLHCDGLFISHPQERLTFNPNGVNLPGNNQNDTSAGIHKVSIGRLVMSEPDIFYTSTDKKGYSYSIKGGKIDFTNWEVNEAHPAENNRFFFAESGYIKLNNIICKKPGILYEIRSSGIQFDTKGKELVIRNITMNPILKHDEYYKRIGVQKEMYKVSFPEVRIKNLDWEKIVRENTLYAASVTLGSPNLEVYLSRFPPPDTQNRVEKFPHQLLRNCEMKMYIPKLYIKNAFVKYTELSKLTNLESHVIFSSLSGTITNVTNIPSYVKRNPHSVASLHGMYKYKSPVTGTFNFLLSDPNGRFSFNGRLTNLDADEISEDSKALNLLEVESLHVHSIDMSMTGNQNTSNGKVTMLYDSLHVKLKKLNSDKELKDKHLGSFMANHVYIFPQNPMPDDIVRTANTSVPRERIRSFFALVWSNLRQGVDRTVIKDSTLAKNVSQTTNPEKHKKGVVKGFFKSVFRKKAKK